MSHDFVAWNEIWYTATTLSETWIKPETPDKEYEIPDYVLFRKDRKAIL